MRQVIYAMQFKGQVASVGTSPSVMKATATATSCTITTIVGPEGVSATLQPAAEGGAVFESEVTLIGGFESEVTSVGEAGFKESGTITFGGGHRLRFSTVGQGYLGPSADPQLKQGSVIWHIDSGEGQFDGAQGLITSNFTVSDAGEVTDHHFGVIFIQ